MAGLTHAPVAGRDTWKADDEADNDQFKIVQDEDSEEIVPRNELSSLRLVVGCP